MPSVQIGDKWLLGRHLVYCEDTSSSEFIDLIPSEITLAIARPSFNWNHGYLIDKAPIVVVILEEDQIYNFCIRQQMPFKFELLIGNLYVAVFSHQSLAKPRKPIEIEGIEGIIAFAIARYTSKGNFVLAPFLGNGESLIACERMGRICVAGDNNPRTVSRSLVRWQNLTDRPATKESNSI
jgi:ParB family transcriptional regulator, chromosome partitioning protein